ncbi:MAG: PRC-barrel domain-containing protein [Candidatus Aenigmatarchaeota archaeon]
MPVNVRRMSEMFGKDVFTDNGEYCGQIENVKVDLGKFRMGSIVLKAKRGGYLAQMLGGKKGVVIPYQFIKAIGDIVIIKHINSESLQGKGKKEAKVEKPGMGGSSINQGQEEEESSSENDVTMPF